MKVLRFIVSFLLVNYLLIGSVLASTDENFCDFSLTLNQSNADDTCNNLPFISPFNDTRTNLILLTDSQKAQQATLAALSSPQNKAPYISNITRKNISAIPFELTIYGAYLDDITNTQQARRVLLAKQLNNATQQLIQQAQQIYQNDPSTEDKIAYNEDELFSSPALLFFRELATTSGLTEQEKILLSVARYRLFTNPKADISDFLPEDPSFSAKHFVSYLLAANAFYKGDYNLANKYFTEASQAAQPWIKETANYMLARNFLNQGQAIAFNNWGELDPRKIDQTAITNSRVAFNNYLKQYPQGLYANSSSALLRRIYWLQDNKTALANSYENLLENPQLYINNNTSIKHSMADLLLEIDTKIYFNQRAFTARDLTQTPKLLVAYDMLKMRLNTLTLANLAAQKVDFKHQPQLYHYLLATYYTYKKPDAEKVLKLLAPLADDAREISNLAFSQQILRAFALEAQSKWAEAEQLWITLFLLAKQPYQTATVELGLALHYEKTNQLVNVFTKGSKVTTPQLRYILLRKNATRAELQQLITSNELTTEDKAYTVYLLLYKNLLTAHYQDFLLDSSLLVTSGADNIRLQAISKLGPLTLELFSNAIPSHSNYSCPSPIILANILTLNDKDPRALNCLGEFREHYQLPFAPYIPPSSLTGQNQTGALGTNKPTDFGAHLYSRLKGYQHVINDTSADEDDRAYALFKAIRCFANNGENRCDEQTIPRKERQQWFRLLHTQYAKTPWAKLQTIYW